MKIILITKSHHWGKLAIAIARHIFDDMDVIQGQRTEPFPDVSWNEYAAVVSFLGPWVLPRSVIAAVPLAVNFHPGSREYPGIGCYNFALYENAAEFGCVCHHMSARVDSGPVIDERRFMISPLDDVESLQLKTLATMIGQFTDICSRLSSGETFAAAKGTWSRPPFTRRQLNELATIDVTMAPEEIARRIRATNYPGFAPEIRVADHVFQLKTDRKDPFFLDL